MGRGGRCEEHQRGVRVARMLSAGVAAALIGTIAVAPATGVPSDASESLAQLIVADGVREATSP